MSAKILRQATVVNATHRVEVSCNDWSDPANSDPLTDVFKAVQELINHTCQAPERLQVSIGTHHVLLHHPLLLDRLGNCRELRVLSRQDLAAIFDVKEYVVEGDVQ